MQTEPNAHSKPFPDPALTPIDALRAIVARLRAPDGCPWDREQTHASLRDGLVEEAYEVVEAIDLRDDAQLCDELGDYLLQVVMHSEIAAGENRFTFDDVAMAVSEKLVRRHPHVFGEKNLANSDAVLRQWDEIKRAEKAVKAANRQLTSATETANHQLSESVVDGVSKNLPALMRAEKVQKRAARVGFDWPDVRGVIAKIHEEIMEVEEAMAVSDAAKIEEEIGDLFFSVVNLARRAKVNPEIALHGATQKFIARFQKVEAELVVRGKRPQEADLAELDAIWNAIKLR